MTRCFHQAHLSGIRSHFINRWLHAPREHRPALIAKLSVLSLTISRPDATPALQRLIAIHGPTPGLITMLNRLEHPEVTA
jgi:hypothetical protein